MQEMFLENCGATGWDSIRQNLQNLTVLEMHAWSYKLKLRTQKPNPFLTPPNKTYLPTGQKSKSSGSNSC